MSAATSAGDGSSAVSAALASAMYRALRNLGCRCQHNVPYAGCKIPQITTYVCQRCRCIREYEALQA